MSRIIHCSKLGRDAEGLDVAPYPGVLGQRIYAEISKQAWALWMERQTILINEHKLSVIEPEARAFLEQAMQDFLFPGNAAEN